MTATIATTELKTWKTIKLGTGLKTADDFRAVIKFISRWGNDILGKEAFVASDTEIEVDLVVVTVRELAFSGGPTCKEIYDRALELGLDLCPSEVGPQLRLQYLDQPKGEGLLIAMEPITDSDGRLRLFGVGRRDGGGCWLVGSYGYPGEEWDSDCLFVFVRRK
jgi:hypothetical protein